MRRLPARVALALLAVVGGYVGASFLAQMDTSGAAGEAPPELVGEPAPAAAPGGGDPVVLRMLDNLERWPNLAARIRQFVRHESNQITGVGQYWQQGVGNLRRTAWRLHSLEGEKTTSYEQVFTGKYLWTDRRVGETPHVTRVDVERLARDLNLEDNRDVAGGGDPPAILLARGGLSQLVAELHRSFTFESPAPGRHDGRVVSVLRGRWRPEALAKAWPGLVEGGKWPAHLPHHVLLAAGADNLFPYVVEYRRGGDAALLEGLSGLGPAADPLARYEFFEVSLAAAMPEGVFAYQANDVEWRDVTAQAAARVRHELPEMAGARAPLR